MDGLNLEDDAGAPSMAHGMNGNGRGGIGIVGSHTAADLGSLGDFTATRRLLLLSAVAIVIGIVSAFVALALLRLIAFFTNLFFLLRFSVADVNPSDYTQPWTLIAMPIIGGLIVGFMARYGAERIRGHGIPEALEAILNEGSRVAPRLAILKPVSAAIAIGSGGPFGAEGPIIVTGGAFGSVVAQYLRLSASERKTLLVAGAAGGMAATFAAPLASILLAVELLLFEWRPRSLIPVATASVTAAIVRQHIIGEGPLFPVAPHGAELNLLMLLGTIIVGITAGGLAAYLTGAVYKAEDTFGHLPIHWMWWPAIGGLAIGIGGVIFPPALGVGYDNIRELLTGDGGTRMIIGVLLVKSTIWAVSLGSGTSGGILAPLLMMGAALGAAEAHFLPDNGVGFWALIGMGAALGGTTNSPLTGVVFPLELTHDFNSLIPLIIAVTIAHTFTVLLLRRSILTEKLARRGRHVSREYALDPLELLLAREVLHPEVVTLPNDMPTREVIERLARDGTNPQLRSQRLFPVLGATGQMLGVVSISDIDAWRYDPAFDTARLLQTTMQTPPIVAYPDEPLRVVAERMAQTGRTRLPVVARSNPHELLGLIGLPDLLMGRARDVRLERTREQIRSLRLWPHPRRLPVEVSLPAKQ
jgi:H+/Cl- antiporter ClcA/CBS domain-containing protein